MFRRKTTEAASAAIRALAEPLESRTLLSTVDGLTPAQVRKAYAFDEIVLGDGSIAADGRGQTIAIINAYHNPNIAADLAVFNAQFGLPAANLKVVNQTGGGKLPATDEGWASEIALDVEWAHAIAPAASILLVEANSALTSDLMIAVDYARHIPGVSTISMSWGGSEFFSFAGGSESESQLAYDKIFTTPTGHSGITFLAASGDGGQAGGVQWPSTSPNVVAVGGTALHIADSSGTYLSEGPWRGFRSGAGGGFSQVEPEPDYQQVAQQTGSRSTPDVGYNADPNTGFAVYDTVSGDGWTVVGGTSAGAPQWAALIAIANQGRAMGGLGTLDGRSQTLPGLYGLYSAPGTTGYTSYTTAFNDIGNDGYGYTTGLGTPHADVVVAALIGNTGGDGGGDTGGDTGGGDTGGTGTTPDPKQQTLSPIAGKFRGDPPASAIAGESGKLRLDLRNTSLSRFTGPVDVTVYASLDDTVSAEDVAITTTAQSLDVRAGGSKKTKIAYVIPATLAAGDYSLIVSVTPTGSNNAPTRNVSDTQVAIATPVVDLSATFADGESIKVKPGHNDTAVVTIRNLGNVTATGTLDLKLFASGDTILDAADTLLTTISSKAINLKPGRTLKLRVHFPAPADKASGTYSLLSQITDTLNLTDTISGNDVAAIGTR